MVQLSRTSIAATQDEDRTHVRLGAMVQIAVTLSTSSAGHAHAHRSCVNVWKWLADTADGTHWHQKGPKMDEMECQDCKLDMNPLVGIHHRHEWSGI